MSKKILIAGSNGNVGKTVTELFINKGWNVVGIDIENKNESKATSFYTVDIKDTDAITKTVEIIEKAGPIDALFNAAGYEINKDFEEVRSEEWDCLLDTVLGGSGNLCKAVAPKMVNRKDGKIILLSCDYSKEQDCAIIDAVAAHTLHGFGKSFGVEMAPENVLVNVLFANTPLDYEKIAETVFFLADKDTYTSAQVISISGAEK